ncbi:3-oxoacyl-[acyl-carrier-protein] synthase I, chloroplastic, partial [Mucuna pruriens]
MQALHSPTLRASPLDPLRQPNNAAKRRATAAKRVFFVSATAAPKVSAPQRQKDPKKRVVITGMGLASVFGNDVNGYYDKLLAGESGITLIDRFDASKFPTRFGGQIRHFSAEGYIDGKNDRRLDDCLRYCIVAGKKALESADLAADNRSKVSLSQIYSLFAFLISFLLTLSLFTSFSVAEIPSLDRYNAIDKERAGVLVGSGMGGLTVFSDGVQALIEKGHRKITPFFIPYAITNMGSALLGIDLGFMGPNYSISTACATSNYCFYAAANHIRRGEADLMIAGGTEAAIIPIGLGGFVACRALSQRNDDPKTASRPWDRDRDGFVMGEGAGVLVMESLEHAMKRGAPIIAEYLGGAVNCDAYHMTDPRSDGLGVSSCIQSSLEDAGVSPEEVNYINAHATSTLAGDLAEINAIKKVFKDTSGIKINATKSMIGHCLGAAGGLEAIATVKAITTGWLHPSINQFNPEPAVDFDTVANVKQQHEVNPFQIHLDLVDTTLWWHFLLSGPDCPYQICS